MRLKTLVFAARALGKDKRACETGITPHPFGAAGALAGIGLAWLLVRVARAVLRSRPRAIGART